LNPWLDPNISKNLWVPATAAWSNPAAVSIYEFNGNWIFVQARQLKTRKRSQQLMQRTTRKRRRQ
jgi:hypothetical protein